nr:response regulator [uncultured Sulfurimonas sp.]
MGTIKELKYYAKDLSILVVEDDEALNEQMVEIVSLFFKRVDFAYNGKEALKKYKNNPVDILMTDITMPKMDGVELSKKVKYINNDQSIIIVSAHCHLDYLTAIVDIGIDQFIKKPFEDEELLYRLLKVCENIVLKKSTQTFDEKLFSIKEDSPKTKPKEDAKAKEKIQSVVNKKTLNAQDFLQNINTEASQDIEHLFELVEDLEEFIQLIYINGANREYLNSISIILSKIHTILSQISSMDVMSGVIFDLSSFLEKLDFNSLSNEQINKLNLLDFIYDDISNFIKTVFSEGNTHDVNYLEDSLKSSIEQLEQSMFQKEEQADDDGFELF